MALQNVDQLFEHILKSIAFEQVLLVNRLVYFLTKFFTLMLKSTL